MPARRACVLLLTLTGLACTSTADDKAVPSTLGDPETEESGALEPTPYCGDMALGCVLESGQGDLGCASACELEQPCPTATDSANGQSVEVGDPLCIVEALRTMEGPMQLVHGYVVDTGGGLEPYYDSEQWTLWIVGPNDAILRARVRSVELAGETNSTRVVGGTLPPREDFAPCLEQPGDAAWECAMAAIEWCTTGVAAGPSGEAPWCPE